MASVFDTRISLNVLQIVCWFVQFDNCSDNGKSCFHLLSNRRHLSSILYRCVRIANTFVCQRVWRSMSEAVERQQQIGALSLSVPASEQREKVSAAGELSFCRFLPRILIQLQQRRKKSKADSIMAIKCNA